MLRSRSEIGDYFENLIRDAGCLVCGEWGGMRNLNKGKANYPHVDIHCRHCDSFFQVKASSQKYNLKHKNNNIYIVNLFRERIVNEAIALYGDNYRIIAIEYSTGRRGNMDIKRMVLSARIRKVIKANGGVDAVEIVGSRVV